MLGVWVPGRAGGAAWVGSALSGSVRSGGLRRARNGFSIPQPGRQAPWANRQHPVGRDLILEFRRDRLLHFPTDHVELDRSFVMTTRSTFSHRTDSHWQARLWAATAWTVNGAGNRVSNLETARPTPPLPSTLMLRMLSCPRPQATGEPTRITTIDPFEPALESPRHSRGDSRRLDHQVTTSGFDPDPAPRSCSRHRVIQRASTSVSSLNHQLIQRSV